jgi:DNA-binding MarR family transcriptional regulator
MDGSSAREPESAEDDPEILHLEAFLPYRLSVASNLVSRAFARRYQSAFGLSIPEWRVIAVLGRFAPAPSQEICERTAMDKAKVSRAVTRLVASGLVVRGENPQDQRRNRLTLSRKGLGIYRRIVPLTLELQSELVAGLAPAELAELNRILRLLAERAKSLDTPLAAGQS